RAGAGEAEALFGLGDDVGQARGITPLRVGGEGAQRILGLDDRAGDRRRVAAIDDGRREAVVAHVAGQPAAPPSCTIWVRCSMRRPLRIITGIAYPLSSARHQRGAQSWPRCSSNAPSLRKATTLSPGSGMCTYCRPAKPR